MKIKIYLAIILGATLAACSSPAITTPSPTAVAQPTRNAATNAPAPTQPGSASPVPASPTQVIAFPPVQLAPPQCSGTLAATPAVTEGPFYKANTPEKSSLVEPGIAGTKIIVTGYVVTRDCKPIGRALLDFWQADDQGNYDNAGYRLRGHIFSDANGRYSIETILPGLYPGRTRHIHVKVSAANAAPLTTQLYFPSEARNQSDSIFNRALLVTMQDAPSGKIAAFNFVLNAR